MPKTETGERSVDMKVLMVHKFYYVEGGAERYVYNLSDLLQERGVEVIPFASKHPKNDSSPYNDYFAPYFNPGQFSLSKPKELVKNIRRTIFNTEAQRQLERLIEDTQPDIAHVHSIYHHLSPSIFPTLKKYNLPVMMTLHDYKLVCPNYIFLDGKRQVCEACRGKHFWKATAKKCFRDSYGASLLVSAEAYYNYCKHSHFDNIDVLVSPSKFLGDKISQYGYQNHPVLVQPYTLDLSKYEPCYETSDYFVFMGRLTHEKGVHFLLDSMKQINGANLVILGTGPLENEMRRRVETENLTNVKMLGYKSGDELKEIVRKAKFTVITSEWHDNSPLVIYESLSLGNPIVGAQMGGIPELIEEGKDGYTFARGDMETFVKHVNTLNADPERCIQMGKAARAKAERLYGFDEHFTKIMELYDYTRTQAEQAHAV